ncbi:MAG: hypothetical protein Q7U39_19195 [Nitrospira sp.]|nr:hypothetical protein [Nitrospira sp.]
MEQQKKESYSEPVLVAHELLRDVTGQKYKEQCQKAVDAVCVS